MLIQIKDWQEWLTPDDKPNAKNSNHPTNTAELAYFQLARQLTLATLIIQSAYQRFESRGGHYRHDYPNLTTKPLVSVIKSQPSLAEEQSVYFEDATQTSQNEPYLTETHTEKQPSLVETY